MKEINREYVTLAKTFLKTQRKNHPNLLRKITGAAVRHSALGIDKCVRIDGHDLKEVERAVMWATEDDFWSPNLLSLATLRNKSKSNGNTKLVNIMASMERSRRNGPSNGGCPVKPGKYDNVKKRVYHMSP